MLALALALSSLAAPAAGPLPEDLVALVPSNAAAIVACDSLEDLAVFSGELAPLVFELLPADFPAELIDRTRPFALVVGKVMTPITGALPPVFVLLPCQPGAQAKLESWTGDGSRALELVGDYAGLASVMAYPTRLGESDLPGLLPSGLARASADLRAVMFTYRGALAVELHTILQGAEWQLRQDAEISESFKTFSMEGLAVLVDAIEAAAASLDVGTLSADVEGAQLHLHTGVSLLEGSALSQLGDAEGVTFADVEPMIEPGCEFWHAGALDPQTILSWFEPWLEAGFQLLEVEIGEESSAPGFEMASALLRDLFDGYRATGDAFAAWVEPTGQIHNWLHNADIQALVRSVTSVTESPLSAALSITASRFAVPGGVGLAVYFPPSIPMAGVVWGLSHGDPEDFEGGFLNVEFRSPAEFQERRTSDWSLVTLFSKAGDSERVMEATLGQLADREPGRLKLRRDLGAASPFSVEHRPIGPLVVDLLGPDASSVVSAELLQRLRADTRPFEFFAGIVPEASTDSKQARAIAGARIDLDLAGDFVTWLWATPSEWLEEDR